MLLFAGLGNPGRDYAGNRHNAGFMAVDALADWHGFSGWKARGGAQVAEGRVGTQKIIAIKPQGYMNKSGLPVAEIARFYKIPPEDLFVFHDEIDLAAGKIRVKRGGGHGGHNGIRDIDRHLGTDYWRVRIGVGRPGQVIPGSQIDIRKWVLMDFTVAERDGWLASLLRAMADEAPLLAAHDEGSFMSRVAHLAPVPKSPVPESETGTDMASNAGTSPDGEET